MSAITDVRDQVQSAFSRVVFQIRRSLFGMNNERIDFLMDSFYKLSPQQQTGLLAGVAGSLLVFVLGAFTIYFSRINALEDELNQSFDSLQEIRLLNANYDQELKRFQELKGIVARNSADFKPKPYFESKSNQVGVQIQDLRSQDSEISGDSALATDFRYSTVEFRLPKVSLPRLLKFIEEVEKGNPNLNFHSLQVRTRYGDRLFFETNAKVVAYKTAGG
ncbi:MAG: hypothetical protein EOP10_20200 [Proteobacteria bacterium]|nr:MAG: hypothetical protein EOP10_20200 [Pseudomonadota bacterium]